MTRSHHHISARHARRWIGVPFCIFAACGGESPVTPIATSVQSITVTPSANNLSVGNTLTVVATAFTSAGAVVSGPTFTWSSSNTSIATVTSVGVVTGVAPGEVTISATAASRTGSAIISVSPAVPRNFSIVDAQLTQGVQSADGSIPMMLGSKPAVLNVMVGATTVTSAARTQIVLRLFDASGTMVRIDTALTETQFVVAPTTAAPSVQFLIPASAIQSGMRWQVVRDPKRLISDYSASDDVYPRSGTAAIATTDVPPLTLKFVPITLSAHNNSTAALAASQLPDFTRTLESVMPVGTISTSIAPAFASQSNFGAAPRGGDLPFWTQLLSEIDLARLLDTGDPRTYWVGVVIPPAGFNFAIYGGVGYVPGNGATTGARTRTTALVGPGWYTNPTGARDGVAHELGHNFGRLHAPCGAVLSSFDLEFPNAGGLIGTPGHDVYSWWKGLTASAPVMTSDIGDVMGYCQRPWASPYTFDAAMRFRRAGGVVGSYAQNSRQPVLLVRGSIENGRVKLEPAFTATTFPTQPEALGPYRLEGFDALGHLLFSYAFAPAMIDHATAVGHFTFALPLTDALQSSLSKLRVSSGTVLVELTSAMSTLALNESATSSAPRRVKIVRNANGGLLATCTDRNVVGILVQDATRGTLLATNASSTATFPERSGTSISVQCSDGVRSATYTMRAP